ncbi:MAG: RNA methyltransferase [Microgenomates group bacterium]
MKAPTRQGPPTLETTARQGKLNKVIDQRREGVVVLQDIHDPHNAAAVWRNCDAMGWQKVYLIFEQEKVFNPKKVGKVSSSSANKWLDFKIFKSTKECYEMLKNEGYKIYVTVLDKEAVDLSLSDFRSQKKIAIVFGNEHRGVTQEAIDGADAKIYIPMRGMVQSLNLSVSAGIVLWEVERQRGQETGNWKLETGEKEEIKKRWR